jgi:hypothetical protein
MSTNEKVIAQSTAVGVALLAVLFAVLAYLS